ncbi:hypothetical protein V5O48_011781 [Marasmius crinis-equi]|uniref:Uncharacterized protein n=1 Tax=Marasmius crinis-equi TaxID=585013 RepID=A0ABR3F4N7_9AGAR
MQSPQNRGGYSAFFSSGYRAIRTRCQPEESVATASSILPFPQHSDRKPSQPSPLSRTLRPPSEPPKKNRRNSVVELFDKVTSSRSNATKRKKDGRRHSFIDSDLLSKALVGHRRQRTTSSRSRSDPPPQHHPIDPFSSSPESSSFFIDLDLTDSPTYFMKSPQTSRSKRFSFLSLSSSSNDSTRFNLPRRDRPTSVHTLPAPYSNDHLRSSVHSVSSYAEKLEQFAHELSEELEEISLSEEWSDDDPGNMDWRQFHVELLGETSD